MLVLLIIFTSIMPVGSTARRSISFVFLYADISRSIQSKADRQPETCQSTEIRQLFSAKSLKHLSKQCERLPSQGCAGTDNGPRKQKFWDGVEESDGSHPKPHKLSLGELGIRNVVVAAQEKMGTKQQVESLLQRVSSVGSDMRVSNQRDRQQ